MLLKLRPLVLEKVEIRVSPPKIWLSAAVSGVEPLKAIDLSSVCRLPKSDQVVPASLVIQ